VTAADLVAELRRDVRDERVLAAIGSVPRERFVGEGQRSRAWENTALAIGCGQTISQPLVVARMCEALAVAPGERVLDVGTGSGYHAAVLAALGARVWSVERHRTLSASAAANLAAARVEGVVLVVGDGRRGHPEAAPFDAICVAATAQGGVPGALLDQLAPRGRLVAPVRDGDGEHLVLFAREAGGGLRRTPLEPVRFVPLLEGVED
jgi:protein-L-isoaspartate(D-aspartate) O-methyltransferase